jgi:preprotein translocase subunit YajC
MAGTFYFLIWRPQQRRVATVRALQSALSVGDEVITTGGIYGTVRSIDAEIVEVEIAPELVVRVARGAIGARITEDEAPIDVDGADGPEETL